jgi:hypothetical protein
MPIETWTSDGPRKGSWPTHVAQASRRADIRYRDIPRVAVNAALHDCCIGKTGHFGRHLSSQAKPTSHGPLLCWAGDPRASHQPVSGSQAKASPAQGSVGVVRSSRLEIGCIAGAGFHAQARGRVDAERAATETALLHAIFTAASHHHMAVRIRRRQRLRAAGFPCKEMSRSAKFNISVVRLTEGAAPGGSFLFFFFFQ